MSQLDDFFASRRNVSTEAASNPTELDTFFSDRRQQQAAAQEAQVRKTIEFATKDDPEIAAERRRLSQTSGLPLRVVEQNLAELRAKESAKAYDLVQMSRTSPVLYRQLMDPQFTAESIDDVFTLQGIEQAIGGTASYLMGARPDGGIVGDLKGSIYRSAGAFAGAKRAAVDVIEPWARLVQGDQNFFAEMSKNYAAQGKVFDEQADKVGSKVFGVSSGVQSLGQNLKYLPLALAGPGGGALALGGMVMESFGSSYNKAADKNLPLWQSLGYASADAMVEYWTEKLPMDALIGGLKQGAPLIQTLAKQMALEIPGEQLATVLQNANEWATLNPGKSFKDFLAEQPEAMAETLIATIIGTGGNVMVSQALATGIDAVTGATSWRDNLTDTYQEMLNEQLKLAGQSVFRERSPEQFRTHIQTIVEEGEGAPKEVYVDGEVLNQLPQDVLAQLPEAVREQIPTAAAMGEVVAIPMADVLTVAPNTPLEQMLNEHARMDPFAETQAEKKVAAEQAQQRIKADTERVIQQAADQAQARLDYETVKDDLAAQITTAGRYSPAVAETYAAGLAHFFVAYGERSGKGTVGLYQEYKKRGFRIVGQRTGNGGVLNDQRLDQITPEQAMATNVPVEMPATPEFGEAVGNTPGAQVTENGLLIDLVRFQKPEQEGAQAIRTGVFYLPAGSKQVTGYKGGNKTYGGTEKFEGQTLIRRPLFVKGATGGKAPEAAYDQLKGKGAYQAMRDEVLNAGRNYAETRAEKAQRVAAVLAKYGADPSLAFEIVNNSTQGNQLAYAVQENIVAHAVREAGYDAVVGYSKAKGANRISEVFDVREQTFPARGMESEVAEVFNQSARQKAGPDAPGVGLEEGNKLGFWPALRVKLAGKLKLPEKAPILTGTTNANAAKQIGAIDAILKKFPKATESTAEWTKMMAYALGSTEVPIPPYAFIRDLNGTGSLDKLRTLTQGQIDDASHGFENAAEFRRAYIAGELGVETTGKLFMWSFLSRGVSPYTQEALFIDAFDGADKWIAMAARGEFTKEVFPEYEAWAKSVAPKGSGQPGAGATHNLNAFGQDFLLKMSRVGEDGKTHMQRLHDMMSDPNQTGKQIRREFATFGEGVGIDNKVVSFTLLVAGFPDVMVLDRVQIRQLWDDGRFNGVNLYDGVSEKRMVTGRDGKTVEKNVSIAGSSLNSLAEGARGILVYEAIERGLEAKIQQMYADLGRPQDASIGRYHWETWVADSQQEASHGTLGAILADAKGDDQAIASVSAKQGEYGAYEYGALYNRDSDGTPWFGYETPTGGQFAFSVPAFRAFLEDIKRSGTGVVPAGFKVTNLTKDEDGNKTEIDPGYSNGPWFNRPGVNQARLDERASYWADRAGGSGEGQRAIEEALQQQAADRARSSAAGQSEAGDVNGQLEQAGDGAGRATDAGSSPLPGAPVIAGATGPDPRLVAVAEQYARDNGIDFKRQADYVQVDPERAARIAQAYEEMQHAPNDPAVQEAYQNLIQQTLAQYRALEAAGYKFWFIDPTNDPYKSPWDAMREMRASQTMGVFPTVAGFGSNATDTDLAGNPLEADTGIMWPYGSPDGELKPVLANDLFRAVHDAFGHGLEGAGFRAQGEENAWQAHIRLFTGSAVAAITTETRGQNSWLNFGPYGEQNQTAKVEDTVFADQKTGLMPEWTWSEGRAGDMAEGGVLEQGPRGTFSPSSLELVLNPNADLSTLWHEMGHFFLEVMADVATQPDAPAQIVADYQAFLKWAGVSSEEWAGFTLDQKRPYHERWAETVEQYIMEGKVPNVELQPLLRRFRSWMLSVYDSIQKFLADKPDAERQPLNEDIRRVLDRMLATDAQIAQAEEVAGMVPEFDATNEAREKLEKRSMRDLRWTVRARDAAIKKLQKLAVEIRKSIEAEVRAEVELQPVYRAINFLRYGKLVQEGMTNVERKALDSAAGMNIKLDLPALKEMYGDGPAAPWRYLSTGKTGLAASEGVHPDIVADMLGFESGDALVRQILAAEDIKSVIEGMTEQRMLEEHGDLVDERAVQEAANEAVHNEARARALATELRSQAEMLGARTDTGETNARGAKITTSTLMEAAKQFAANVIARTPLRDLKNRAWQHTAAERRAAKRWQEATAAGKTEEAVKAKQDQVLNNAAARAALDAKTEMDKILQFFKRVIKDGDEKTVEKGRDPDVVNAARAILAAYGIETNQTKRASEYMALLAKNDPTMYAALQPYVEGALQLAQPLEALTFEELQSLHDTINQLWFLSKRSRQMEVDGNLMDIEDAADELVTRMGEIGIPDTIPGETGAITDRQERGIKLQFAKAILSRVEQWSERLDGKFGGPFLRLVFQPVKDAADRYRTEKVEYRKKFTELLKVIAPQLPPGAIEAPELGYTFGNARDSGVAELLHAILHTGNDSNKRKLLLGRGWATENADGTLDTSKWDAFLKRLASEGKITQDHFRFAQGVWDLLEQMKPLAQETHRKVFGRYFAEVTANEFVDPFGNVWRGGYVPAQTDSRLVKDAKLRELAEGENESMAYAFPAAPSGFTKSRVEYNQPLLLDLRALGQHMDKVLLFSHMQGAVTDVRRLLTNKRVSYALDRIDPAAYEGMLIPWLNRSARQVVETPVVGDRGLARMLGKLRGRAGMALMVANLSNTVQQITGFSSAAVKVKPGLLLSATARFAADPKGMKTTVAEASPYMKDRMLNEVGAMNDAVEAILIDPTLLEKSQAWTQRHAYFLQAAVDNTMSPIIWTAAYNQAIEQKMDEKEAVRFADGVIRQTQGTTLPEDISRFETGPGYARLFTQFVSYFNMMANTNATAMKQIADDVGLRKGAGRLIYVAVAGVLAPIWVAEAIAQAFRGGPEDEDKDGWLDDWLMAVFGLGTVRGLVAQVPIVGQLAQVAVNRFNDNPADDKFSLSPAVSLLESAVSSPASVYNAVVEDGNKQKAVRDVAAAATMITGLPIYGVARPIGYLAGMAGGSIEPTGPADLARGLVTGTASPESKQR